MDFTFNAFLFGDDTISKINEGNGEGNDIVDKTNQRYKFIMNGLKWIKLI